MKVRLKVRMKTRMRVKTKGKKIQIVMKRLYQMKKNMSQSLFQMKRKLRPAYTLRLDFPALPCSTQCNAMERAPLRIVM